MGETDRATDDRLFVAVVRTGGIAGIRRQWRVTPADDDAERWVELVESCPWDASEAPDAGVDRYVWTIRARIPGHECVRKIPDGQLAGPWRELVDAVRAAQT
jgi:hypothetical protein